ncbi:hypothetical protein [Flavobacterium sp. '19STA2R22 D10 B1']|uniref:hypothetical protein n=1 Tax=Flavobacterium aerium TaxID=3037261 RepID=UPI00278BEA65|nr:hypothetical protein [Flavobacterium sp. '19STA2R22 D10 B1']
MKKFIFHLFLLTFLYQSTSSFWIVSSFFINQEYIANTICINRFDAIPICNGKCFLSKELKENEKKEQKLPNVKDKEIQLFCTTTIDYLQKVEVHYEEHATYPEYKTDFIVSSHLFSVFHPPKPV